MPPLAKKPWRLLWRFQKETKADAGNFHKFVKVYPEPKKIKSLVHAMCCVIIPLQRGSNSHNAAINIMAVHRSNNSTRDATPGQKAMTTAMAWPEAVRGGNRGNQYTGGKLIQSTCQGKAFDKVVLSRARYVLRHNPTAED